MKRIRVDFNGSDMKRIRLMQREAKFFELEVGEKVFLYDEGFQFEAIAMKCDIDQYNKLFGSFRQYEDTKDLWYAEITSEVEYFSEEIEKAMKDGERNGFLSGVFCLSSEIEIKMRKKGYSEEEIKELTNFYGYTIGFTG